MAETRVVWRVCLLRISLKNQSCKIMAYPHSFSERRAFERVQVENCAATLLFHGMAAEMLEFNQKKSLRLGLATFHIF